MDGSPQYSLCCCSVAQSGLTLCNSVECSTPGQGPLLSHYLKLMSTELMIHTTISFSVAPFSSCPQTFPASRSFPVSQLLASDGQRIRASASALPMNIQGYFSLALTSLISLLSKGLSRVFWNPTVQKHQVFGAKRSLWSSCHNHT